MVTEPLLLYCDPDFDREADLLRNRYGFVRADKRPKGELYLMLDQTGLSLVPGRSKFKPLRVDFKSGPLGYLSKRGFSRSEILARAIGVDKKGIRVLDATAGLGRDLFKFHLLGCQTAAAEKSPVVCALLADGLQRAGLAPSIQLHFGSFEDLLRKQEFDVVYLDPMYPDKPGSALAGKEMQILHELIEPEMNPEKLVSLSLEHCRRVVLKRPKWAKAETRGIEPTHVFKGKSTNYEVWVKSLYRD